jgi:hypothetical protein
MAKWKCLFCGETKEVINGVCPKCGPTQTIPMDEEAKQEGGFYVAEEEKKAKEEAAKEIEGNE